MKEIIHFIKSLYPAKEKVPLHEPCLGQLEEELVQECIRSTFVSTVGKFVEELEEKVRSYTGAEYAVATVNGTQALFLALKVVGVRQGDLVITQALSFIATANAIAYCGAEPLFLDVDEDTLGLSPLALREFLERHTISRNGETFHKESNRRIVAVVPMHTLGHPCRIFEIQRVCLDFNLYLVEDAAESLGSFEQGRHTGTSGLIGTLSFNGNKIITTGGGGMLLTSDPELARRLRHISTTAKVPHPYEFIHDEVGYNYRMPNLNAALGVAQMLRLPELLEKKRALAGKYQKFFEDRTDALFFKGRDQDSIHPNYWLNCLLFPDAEKKENFLVQSNEAGVLCRSMWKPLNRLEMYSHCIGDDLSVTGDIYDRAVHCPGTVELQAG